MTPDTPRRPGPPPADRNRPHGPNSASGARPPIRDVGELRVACSLPGPLFRVLEALRDERGTKFTVARALEQDPDLAERVLKAANSPVYLTYEDHIGKSGPGITNLPTAVMRIGLSAVRNLAYTQGICQLIGDSGEIGQGIVGHLLVVAETSWLLGNRASRAFAEDAYLAGLLHDFGKIVLLKTLPEDYAAIAAWCRRHGQTAREAEGECFRTAQPFLVDHVKTGAEVMRAHSLPEAVLFSVEHHHDGQVLEQHAHDPHHLTATVILADLIAHAAGLGDGFSTPPVDLRDFDRLAALGGLPPTELHTLAQEAATRAQEALSEMPRAELPPSIERTRIAPAAGGVDPIGDLPHPASADYRAYEKLIGFARAVSRFSLPDAQMHTGLAGAMLEDLVARLADKGYLKQDRRHTYHRVYRALPALQRASVQEILSELAAETWRRPGDRRAA